MGTTSMYSIDYRMIKLIQISHFAEDQINITLHIMQLEFQDFLSSRWLVVHIATFSFINILTCIFIIYM